ncbi:MAG: rRNA methyltransferase [Trueperaceae bacterium]|jgi:16S rRNA (guanine1516-N2)-methyltransferase|nr:rRNA methyltransferase [Trueperaceae bacterium]MCH2667946.1 class I SAM-dependent methyltransferase [Deinococcales bacterium]|tara:strand:- start:1103 stop:1867 length:765 start_codon:yes stop_codon:yes gene_type:complete
MIGISAAEDHLHQRASLIAENYGLPILPPGENTSPFSLLLTQKHLELREDNRYSPPLYVDFGKPDFLRRFSGRRRSEELFKALGSGVSVDSDLIVDTTAGLGKDAFMLAAWGYRVQAIERVPAVAALLDDGLKRARVSKSLEKAANRITSDFGDARELLPSLIERPAVVYLDPMYPQSAKRARKSLGMHRLRQVLGDDTDAKSLLEIALRTARYRVIVKRSRRAPILGGVSSGSIVGRTIRFDLYAPIGNLSLC